MVTHTGWICIHAHTYNMYIHNLITRSKKNMMNTWTIINLTWLWRIVLSIFTLGILQKCRVMTVTTFVYQWGNHQQHCTTVTGCGSWSINVDASQRIARKPRTTGNLHGMLLLFVSGKATHSSRMSRETRSVNDLVTNGAKKRSELNGFRLTTQSCKGNL